ncbi:MAG: hypothetical protein SGARI_001407, partial [Bacillariaceae sp.]
MAQFVASVMRDKTVEELMEKVQQQEKQIKGMMKVEITGQGGRPVYMAGQFDEGDYHRNRSNWWCPKMKEQTIECTLQSLRGVEVRVGGIVQFSLDENGQSTKFWMDNLVYEEQGEDIEIMIETDDDSRLYVMIKNGGEQEEWRRLQFIGLLSRRPAGEALDLLEEKLPDETMVKMGRLILGVSKYQALMDKVPQSKDQKERRHWQLHVSEYHIEMNSHLQVVAPQLGVYTRLEMARLLSDIYIKKATEEFELVWPNVLDLCVAYNEQHTSGIDDIIERELQDVIGEIEEGISVNRPRLLEQLVAGLQQMAQRR